MLSNIRSQRGFGHIEVLLVLILLSIISFAGYYVYSQSKDSRDDVSVTAGKKIPQKDDSASIVLDKSYINTQWGFSFKYPSTWKLSEDLEDFDGMEFGTISVTSTEGVKTSFNLSTGKGGDCLDDSSDRPHNTENCTTLEILDNEPVSIVGAKETYLYRYKSTLSRDENGRVPASEYGVYMSSDFAPDEYKEPIIGAVFGMGDIVSAKDGTSVGTSIHGSGDTSADFFNQTDVKTAEKILKSFKYTQ